GRSPGAAWQPCRGPRPPPRWAGDSAQASPCGTAVGSSARWHPVPRHRPAPGLVQSSCTSTTMSGRAYPSLAATGQRQRYGATVRPCFAASTRMTAPRPSLLMLAVCLAFSPAALPANDLPSLGDASSAIIAPEQEYQLGRAWLSMLRRQVPQLSDPLLKDFVERHVYRLAETS